VPDAIAVIHDVVRKHGKNILVGAGTVTTAEQANQCLDAGVDFLVSPGLCVPVLEIAADRGKLAIPGALTPTEFMSALEHGATLVKIFPCSSAGGPSHIKALRGPFPDGLLIPTGGVNLASAAEYLAAGAFALGVGSELANLSVLREGRVHEITHAAESFAQIVRRCRPLKSTVQLQGPQKAN
jgi:2-dehydro-3-deoxyphosphogluconate aldolase / (4S)-4-hydroxy-2-oxoglutarate aldolase